MGKSISEIETYKLSGTEYLLVETNDGWYYRFLRPNDSVPFTFDIRQRPDGTRSDRDCYLPDSIVNILEDSPTWDVSDLKGKQSSQRRD